MSRNANGKRPAVSEDHGESSKTKRHRNNPSFSPETSEEAPTQTSPMAPAPEPMLPQVPETKPDIGIKTFLNDYLATHTATDPLFRKSISALVEDRFDYEGVRYADRLRDEIMANGSHHHDVQAVQTIIDQELSFKWARLLMSLTLTAGHLPTIMNYIGKISAEKFDVQLNHNFEIAVQNFLIQVGHTPVIATNASAQRQMSVMPVGEASELGPFDRSHTANGESGDVDHEQTRNDGTAGPPQEPAPECRGYHCSCDPQEKHELPRSRTEKQRIELLKSDTPIVDMVIGMGKKLGPYPQIKSQRKKIITKFRARAEKLPSHILRVSKLSNLKAGGRDIWYENLIKATKQPNPDLKRQEVEAVLHVFADANRCLFPELRRFNSSNVKQEGN
ncbi:hypothetical protein E2P81_ATG00317 [Venturia nashicola]|nr:hypothetical protein E2P81_ATG00317 [Venturia nashicola]